MKHYFECKHISSNDIYAGIHWTTRKRISREFHDLINIIVKRDKIDIAPIPCEIEFGFSGRIDIDNCFYMAKMIIDGLRESLILVDDSRKYVKAVKVIDSEKDYFEINSILVSE